MASYENGTLPRMDLVVIDSAGAIQHRDGTAATAPVAASLTAGDVALAQVYVPAAATVIAAANVIDKRLILAYGINWYNVREYGAIGDGGGGDGRDQAHGAEGRHSGRLGGDGGTRHDLHPGGGGRAGRGDGERRGGVARDRERRGVACRGGERRGPLERRRERCSGPCGNGA